MKILLALLFLVLGLALQAQPPTVITGATTTNKSSLENSKANAEAPGRENAPTSTCTLAITVDGIISAATKDYLQRAEEEAQKRNCGSILMRMNTPGGDLLATHLIVEQILASKFPYLCLITPSGGHAGSAGALILQACHVNGGVAATNVGAATPILSGGQDMSEDLRKKMINDTVSWSQGLAKLRGRDLDFAKDIVTEAKAMPSEEAVKSKALDIFAKDDADFLAKAESRKVQIQDKPEQAVQVGAVSEFNEDFRYKVLNLVADPELAYLMFMASLALLYFEITHPGFVAPGVIGAMGLVLSMIAFNKLEVRWAGLALILLGIGFLIAEVFVPSFGILGVGGVLSLIVGSVFLFDPSISGYSLPISLVLTVSFCLGAIFVGLGFLALKTYRKGGKNLDAAHIGNRAVVVKLQDAHSGQIEILGEVWSFRSQEPVALGDKVEILSRQGLVYSVRKSRE